MIPGRVKQTLCQALHSPMLVCSLTALCLCACCRREHDGGLDNDKEHTVRHDVGSQLDRQLSIASRAHRQAMPVSGTDCPMRLDRAQGCGAFPSRRVWGEAGRDEGAHGMESAWSRAKQGGPWSQPLLPLVFQGFSGFCRERAPTLLFSQPVAERCAFAHREALEGPLVIKPRCTMRRFDGAKRLHRQRCHPARNGHRRGLTRLAPMLTCAECVLRRNPQALLRRNTSSDGRNRPRNRSGHRLWVRHLVGAEEKQTPKGRRRCEVIDDVGR
jgi:hypothetical protein